MRRTPCSALLDAQVWLGEARSRSANLPVDGMLQDFHLQEEEMRGVRLVLASGIAAHAEFSGVGSIAQPSQSNGGARAPRVQDCIQNSDLYDNILYTVDVLVLT